MYTRVPPGYTRLVIAEKSLKGIHSSYEERSRPGWSTGSVTTYEHLVKVRLALSFPVRTMIKWWCCHSGY